MKSIEDAYLVELPRITDPAGNLTFVEEKRHVPFEIRRVFYTYDVPGGESRAGHASKKNEELIVAASGSFDVILDDCQRHQRFSLNRSYFGVYVPNMIWRELVNFSSGSVCLVLASELFDEGDYYRSYDEYRMAVAASA
ncbi:MAG: sugar 3,4-ketoisomerase [Acidimicrobiales bacterium]